MAERLLVLSPFDEYERGDRITAEAAIKRALKSHPDFVLREAAQEGETRPEPEPEEPKPIRVRGHLRAQPHTDD